MGAIGIIGCGRLGGSLASALFLSGAVSDILLIDRTPGVAEDLKTSLCAMDNTNPRPQVNVAGLREAAAMCGTLFLCVPDGMVSRVAGSLPPTDTNPILVHTSGSLGLADLEPARELGYIPGSMHPLNTFPTPIKAKSDAENAVRKLMGTWFAISADDDTIGILGGIAGTIGKGHFRIREDAKPLYHAGAVMASNLLISLFGAVEEIWKGLSMDDSGIPRECLAPLIRQTVENYLEMGPVEALSGPISRGDLGTVEKHIKAMAQASTSPTVVEAYLVLSRICGGLAVKGGRMDGSVMRVLEDLLENGSKMETGGERI